MAMRGFALITQKIVENACGVADFALHTIARKDCGYNDLWVKLSQTIPPWPAHPSMNFGSVCR
ncbi:MAG: hypothetical protein FWD61_08265 [Phycisphaerales bacterium]|nr:hypothetical protein [Phycisphaerales bacterium]